MVCESCRNRKKMIKDAYRQNGVSGVAKELPIVGRDILKNPPRFLKRNGKPVNGKRD